MPKTKAAIIEAVARRGGLPISRAETVVDLMFDTMADALVRGRHIEIRGFGSFTVRSYRAHIGRNPRTGVPVQVREKKLPYFKPGNELRDRVNQARPKSSMTPLEPSGASVAIGAISTNEKENLASAAAELGQLYEGQAELAKEQ
jgi:integration host factor subunit beta